MHETPIIRVPAELTEPDPAQLLRFQACLTNALRAIIACTHRPNPTDSSRIDVAPGKHREFQTAIQAAINLVR